MKKSLKKIILFIMALSVIYILLDYMYAHKWILFKGVSQEKYQEAILGKWETVPHSKIALSDIFTFLKTSEGDLNGLDIEYKSDKTAISYACGICIGGNDYGTWNFTRNLLETSLINSSSQKKYIYNNEIIKITDSYIISKSDNNSYFPYLPKYFSIQKKV